MARTRWPRASNALQTCCPTNPLAPVTITSRGDGLEPVNARSAAGVSFTDERRSERLALAFRARLKFAGIGSASGEFRNDGRYQAAQLSAWRTAHCCSDQLVNGLVTRR